MKGPFPVFPLEVALARAKRHLTRDNSRRQQCNFNSSRETFRIYSINRRQCVFALRYPQCFNHSWKQTGKGHKYCQAKLQANSHGQACLHIASSKGQLTEIKILILLGFDTRGYTNPKQAVTAPTVNKEHTKEGNPLYSHCCTLCTLSSGNPVNIKVC